MEQQVVDLVSPRAEPRAESGADLPPSKRRRAEFVDLVDDDLPASHGESACTRKETGLARVGPPKRTSQGLSRALSTLQAGSHAERPLLRQQRLQQSAGRRRRR